MALSVDYVYKFCLSIIRKNLAGGLTSDDFQYHWNAAQHAYQDDLLGRFNRDNNGKAGINTGLIENQTILTKLAPFTKNATIAFTAGVGPKPSDFKYELGFRVNGKQVQNINHSQIASVNDSVIDAPSVANNLYYRSQYGSNYSILPSSVASASIDYISVPDNVVWGYTVDGDGRQVYSAGTSTQPVWDNASAQEITERMLRTLGVAFSSREMQAFGVDTKNTGS